MNSFCIQLNDCEFFGYHGLYEQEQKDGNTFWVTIKVQISAAAFEATGNLNDSIDYQNLYQIANGRMLTPTPLLEHLAIWIADDIARVYNQTQSIDIFIRKKNPPIGGICHSSEVKYFRKV